MYSGKDFHVCSTYIVAVQSLDKEQLVFGDQLTVEVSFPDVKVLKWFVMQTHKDAVQCDHHNY